MTAVWGVPQGDPLSSLLFDIFIDPFLESSNYCLDVPHHGDACCFADDAILLAPTTETLQKLLSSAETWARQWGMSWNTQKSLILSQRNIELKLQGDTLPRLASATYLGVTMGKSGTTAARLRTCINKALGTLRQLDLATRNRSSDYDTRRMLVKTFVYSQWEYVLYLQPTFLPLTLAAEKLVQACSSWILRTSVPDLHISREARLAELSTLLLRRT